MARRIGMAAPPRAQCAFRHCRFQYEIFGTFRPRRTEGSCLGLKVRLFWLGSLGGALPGNSTPDRTAGCCGWWRPSCCCRRSLSGIAKMTRVRDAWLAPEQGCYAFVIKGPACAGGVRLSVLNVRICPALVLVRAGRLPGACQGGQQGTAEHERPEADHALQGEPPSGDQYQAHRAGQDEAQCGPDDQGGPAQPAQREPGQPRELDVTPADAPRSQQREHQVRPAENQPAQQRAPQRDRKSTRLNSSHPSSSYAVFCLKSRPRAVHGPLLCHEYGAHRAPPPVPTRRSSDLPTIRVGQPSRPSASPASPASLTSPPPMPPGRSSASTRYVPPRISPPSSARPSEIGRAHV